MSEFMTPVEDVAKYDFCSNDEVKKQSHIQNKTGSIQEKISLFAKIHYLLALLTAAKTALGLPFLVSGYVAMGGEESQDVPAWFLTGVHWVAILYDVPEFEKEPAFVALIMFLLGGGVVGVSLVHAVFLTWIGWCLHQRKKLRTILFFSWMDLLYIPLGTILSIFLIYFFRNDKVRTAFLLKR